jgi:hypothetical protein
MRGAIRTRRQGGHAAMNRKNTARWLGLFAAGLIWALPAQANDDEASLRKELDELKSQIDSLKENRTQRLDQEIEGYLESNGEWSKAAQGDDANSRITITAGIFGLSQNSVGQESGLNRSVVNGQAQVGFDFNVAEGLSIVTTLFANTEGHFPSESPQGPTLAGSFDGIGVDSSVNVRPQGGVQILEAFIRYAIPAGNSTINMEMGLIDPRTRFLGTAFSDDYRTQFLHNEFSDPSAISWTSSAAGNNVLGLLFSYAFGENKNFVITVGGFNGPGEWFNDMQLYVEFHWKGEISGRPMNLKFLGVLDNFYTPNGSDDDDVNWGVSWDWMASDKIGVFFILSGNSEDTNTVELSGSIGMIYTGIGSRAADQVGIAFGYIGANTDVISVSEDAEWVVEAFYKYMAANGKFEITPSVQYISEPGGGEWVDDSLWLLSIRFYVPF